MEREIKKIVQVGESGNNVSEEKVRNSVCVRVNSQQRGSVECVYVKKRKGVWSVECVCERETRKKEKNVTVCA